MDKRKFIEDVRRGATDALVEIGATRRNKDCSTFELDAPFCGWVGLNSQTRLDPKEVVLHPVVGVLWQAVNRTVCSATGRKFSPYLPPTISTPLAALMPKRSAGAQTGFVFEVGCPIADRAEAMARAIEEYGLPYMTSNASVESLLERIPRDNGWEDAGERLLAVLYLTGRAAEIDEVAARRLEEAKGRPVAVGRFEDFWEGLRQLRDTSR